MNPAVSTETPRTFARASSFANHEVLDDIATEGLNKGNGWFTNFHEWLVARHRRWRTYRTSKAELNQYEPEKLASFGVADGEVDRVARAAFWL